MSAYGGVIALNRPVEPALAERLAEQFVEVLIAPDYADGGLEALGRKQTRVLRDRERRGSTPGERDYVRVLGGLLVQDADADVDDREGMRVVGTHSRRGDLGRPALLLARRQARALERDRDRQRAADARHRAGQMSRVDASASRSTRPWSSATTSPAPSSPRTGSSFPDGPQLALEAGITAIVQPGGSKRDDEVVAAVDEAGAIMVFTNRRHFRH